MLGSGWLHSVTSVTSGEYWFGDQGPKDWFGELDGTMPELDVREASARTGTPHKEHSNWLRRFASVLRDSFEHWR